VKHRFTVILLVGLLLLCGFWSACGSGSVISDFDRDGAVDSVDCAPENDEIYPGAVELCADETDNDCDGRVDCLDNDCEGLLSCGDDDDASPGDDDTSAPGDDDSASPGDDDTGDDDDTSAAGDDDTGDDDSSADDDDDTSATDDDDDTGGSSSTDPCCSPSLSPGMVGICLDQSAATTICMRGGQLAMECCQGTSMWSQDCVVAYENFGADCS